VKKLQKSLSNYQSRLVQMMDSAVDISQPIREQKTRSEYLHKKTDPKTPNLISNQQTCY